MLATKIQNKKQQIIQDSFTSSKEILEKINKTIQLFQKPDFKKACCQLVNSLGSYVLVWALMWLALKVSWWLTIPLIVLAAGLMIRTFIIFHDCGHGSFFKSQKANDFWGFVCGLVAFTPYRLWRWQHAMHHATSGNLDKRGIGDIWTLTVEEYLKSSPWRRFSYRMSRNPIILFVIAPVFVFGIYQRFVFMKCGKRERASVLHTNIALAVVFVLMSFVFGFWTFLILQAAVLALATSGGLFLFYVQHQFDGAYWEENESWDFVRAAIQGSSFYKLPKILQWFSGNIGFHHIHHLSPRIPNYHLERCHKAEPVFQEVNQLTLWQSFKTLRYRLWDEESKKLVGFSHLKKIKEPEVNLGV